LENNQPLAERMRPKDLNEYLGQKHLVGDKGVIRLMLNKGILPSMIFWGPPGVGKTTLAQLIASKVNYKFHTLSAINAGVKDVREVIDQAKFNAKTLLFIDEIHRFNKSQQDALLGAVEKGIITLIGATTENPSFEVISALLSRCQVYTLVHHTEEELVQLIQNALANDELLNSHSVQFVSYSALLSLAGGDARKLLNLLELVVSNATSNLVTDEEVMQIAQQKVAMYDKNGEQHYDIISAFIKSIRGSDPNAAIYWLARMIEGGEDVKFIARRLLILASEDIGNANPNALLMANNCFQAVNVIGFPEAEIILSQCVCFLATSPKSNSSYVAIKKARQLVKETGDLPVPLHLRNAPTALMKKQGYGKGYLYAHDYDGNFVEQEFMPDKLKNYKLLDFANNPRELEIKQRMSLLWKNKY